MPPKSNQATLTVLIGLPGSGKSTLAKQLGLPIVAVDDFLRTRKAGKKPTPADNQFAREEALRTIITKLKNQESVIFDHTNLTPAVRLDIFRTLKQTSLKIPVTARYFDTDFHTCIASNQGREFNLNPLNIFYLLLALVPPVRKEGFTKIIIEHRSNELSSSPSLKKLLALPIMENLSPSTLRREMLELQLFSDALTKMGENWMAELLENFTSLLDNCAENDLNLTDWPELVAAWLYKDLFRIITEYFVVNHPDSDLPTGANLNELIFDRLLRKRLTGLDLNLKLPIIKNLLTGYFAVTEQNLNPPKGTTEKLLAILLVS